jgi:fluoride exporter
MVVGIGGFLGAIARFALGTYIGSRYGSRFPYGTFVINVSGSFLIGLILPLLARTTASPYWRYLIPIGFIGAYTTFSTFEYETLRAVQDGQITTGLLNIVLSIIAGFVAVWVGAAIGRVLV